MSDTLHFKNKRTGTHETIAQQDLEMVDWGFRFFVDSELEAYKAAYQYRSSKHGAKVQFAIGAQRWMVTVFNEIAARSGVDIYG